MTETLQKDERGYHSVPNSDGRVTTYIPLEQELRFRISELRRFSTWGGDSDELTNGTAQLAASDLKLEPPPPLPPGPEKRVIGSTMFWDSPRFGTISTKGAMPDLHGGLDVEIHVGPEQLSGYRHYRLRKPDDDSDYNSLLLTIFVPQDRMDWLWNELHTRPNAELFVDVTAPLFVSLDSLDGSGGARGMRFIEESSRLSAKRVRIEVADPKPHYPPLPEPKLEPVPPPPNESTTDKLLRQMLNLQSLLLGAVIAAVLFGVGRCSGTVG